MTLSTTPYVKGLYSLGFSSDSSHFFTASQNGISIFSSQHANLIYNINVRGGTAICDFCGISNLFTFVPIFHPSSVIIWNCDSNSPLYQIVCSDLIVSIHCFVSSMQLLIILKSEIRIYTLEPSPRCLFSSPINLIRPLNKDDALAESRRKISQRTSSYISSSTPSGSFLSSELLNQKYQSQNAQLTDNLIKSNSSDFKPIHSEAASDSESGYEENFESPLLMNQESVQQEEIAVLEDPILEVPINTLVDDCETNLDSNDNDLFSMQEDFNEERASHLLKSFNSKNIPVNTKLSTYLDDDDNNNNDISSDFDDGIENRDEDTEISHNIKNITEVDNLIESPISSIPTNSVTYNHTYIDHIKDCLPFSVASNNPIMALASRNPGQVHILNIEARKSSIVLAHSSFIKKLALSVDGELLATASEKGTLIRIFSTSKTKLITEYRRGLDQADIIDLSFNQSGTLLSVISEKGTAHVFALNQNVSNTEDALHSSGLKVKISQIGENYVIRNRNEDDNTTSDVRFEFKSSANVGLQSKSSSNSLANSADDISSSDILEISESGEVSLTSDAISQIYGNTKNSNGVHNKNRRSFLLGIPLLPKYFSSKWSFAQYSFPFEGLKYVSGFFKTQKRDDESLIVLGFDGTWSCISYNNSTNNMVLDEFVRFYKASNQSFFDKSILKLNNGKEDPVFDEIPIKTPQPRPETALSSTISSTYNSKTNSAMSQIVESPMNQNRLPSKSQINYSRQNSVDIEDFETEMFELPPAKSTQVQSYVDVDDDSFDII